MQLPFRRKKDVSVVPAEIKEYYESEKRDRTGIAWMLALGTLVITVGLATLLFFGGRWAYRAVVNNDDKHETAQTEHGSVTEESKPSNDPQESPAPPTTPPGASTGTSSTSTSTPSATSPRTSTVAGSQTNIPNTGPGDLFTIATITTIIGSMTHYIFVGRPHKSTN